MSIGHTIKSVKQGLERGEFSVEEIAAEYRKRIEKENSKLNAYLSVFDSKKLETVNCKLETSPLSGIPCAIKDNILINNEKCTAGSKILNLLATTGILGILSFFLFLGAIIFYGLKFIVFSGSVNEKKSDMFIGALFVLLLNWSLMGIKGVILVVILLVVIFLFIQYAKRKIGGMTGDTIGAANEIAEAATLLFSLILLGYRI